MRLNGSSLNAVPLQGTARIRVAGAGDAAAAMVAGLDGTRVQHGDGNAPAVLAGAFLGSCQRYFGEDLATVLTIAVSPSVARAGFGLAPLVFDGSLYYTQTKLGFGSGLLEFDAKGYVGVVFIDGEAVTNPGEAELTGTRVRQAVGQDAPAVLQADLTARAYRRGFSTVPEDLSLSGDMEGSHIHAGVKYKGGAGFAVLELVAEDGGMIRQNLIGSLDYEFDAAGAGRVLRRPFFQDAPLQLSMGADFTVYRRATNVPGVALPIVCQAELDGGVFVRGGGDAVARLAPECTGYVYRRTATAEAVQVIAVELDAARVRKLDAGPAVMVLVAENSGARVQHGDSVFVMPLIGTTDGIIDPYRDDADDQQFYRPAMERVFARQGHVREWRKA